MSHYLDFLSRQSDALRAEADTSGQRLYAEKGKRFVQRLGAYDRAGASLG